MIFLDSIKYSQPLPVKKSRNRPGIDAPDTWFSNLGLAELCLAVEAIGTCIIVAVQHGHHQAAGLLATEAFSAAADPTKFPQQLRKEGLTVWQPRKLYFAGNSGGVICAIKVDQPLPGGQTPAQIAVQALANHRSQAFGNFRNASWLQRPQSFSLIKSFIPLAENEQDLLRGLAVNDADLKPVTVAVPARQPPLELAFVPRPAFANYRRWVKEQHVEHAAQRPIRG